MRAMSSYYSLVTCGDRRDACVHWAWVLLVVCRLKKSDAFHAAEEKTQAYNDKASRENEHEEFAFREHVLGVY